MVIRRATRCGGECSGCSASAGSLTQTVDWRLRIVKKGRASARPFCLLNDQNVVTRRPWKLFADYGYFGRRHFEPHEAMIRVEEKKDFDIGRGDTEAFVRFAAGGSGADGFRL